MSQLARFFDVMVESMKQVPRFFIPKPDGKSPYLERLILNDKRDADGTSIEKVYLHVIYASDEDRDPHDHPFDFTSQIVYGSYVDHSYDPCEHTRTSPADILCDACRDLPMPGFYETSQYFGPGSKNVKHAADLHRLEIVEGPVVTLVKRGRKYRDWGFQTPQGWVHHVPYITEKFPGAVATEVVD